MHLGGCGTPATIASRCSCPGLVKDSGVPNTVHSKLPSLPGWNPAWLGGLCKEAAEKDVLGTAPRGQRYPQPGSPAVALAFPLLWRLPGPVPGARHICHLQGTSENILVGSGQMRLPDTGLYSPAAGLVAGSVAWFWVQSNERGRVRVGHSVGVTQMWGRVRRASGSWRRAVVVGDGKSGRKLTHLSWWSQSHLCPLERISSLPPSLQK